MALYRFNGFAPQVAEDVYISPEATIIGQVVIHAGVSIWPGAIIRGDNDRIEIGAGSNVQDGAIIHSDPDRPVTIGENVSVGHQAMLHGCTVGAGALVGIQAVILNGSTIGVGSLVGAGAIVSENKKFEGGSLLLGAPAKLVRVLAQEEIERLRHVALKYVERQRLYKGTLVAVG